MSGSIHTFGEFRLNPDAREIERDGELVVLSPKVFDCLVYLIERRDRAIGRDELISAVWGRVDVTDTLLGQAILKARRAVGDTGDAQHAIRTIPRFGYRWVADIETIPITDTPASAAKDAETVATPERADTESSAPKRSTRAPRRLRNAAIVLAVLAVAALVAWTLYPRNATDTLSRASPAAVSEASPAVVLPVTLVAPTSDDTARFSWVRLGIMDLIAERLRQGGLAVVPSSNVVALMRPSAAALDNAAIRAVTGAGPLIAAEARAAADDEWTVRVELRAAGSAPREVAAHGHVTTEVALQAADEVLKLFGLQPPGTNTSPEPDLSVAERLSRAEAALLSDDLDEARTLLENASPGIRHSPEWGLRMVQIDYRAGRLDAARERANALLSSVSAESDPILRGRLLNALGAIDVRADRVMDAERAFTGAVKLLEDRNAAASLGQAYTGRGVTAAAQGRYDIAMADFSRARIALRIAGDNLALARVEINEAVVEAQRGRFPETIAGYERAAARFKDFHAQYELVATLGNLAEAQLAVLRPREALKSVARADSALAGLANPLARSSLDLVRIAVLLANGQLVDAQRTLADLLARVSGNGDPSLLARVQAEQATIDRVDGRNEEAARLATQAVAALDARDYIRDRAAAWLTLIRAQRANGKDAAVHEQIGRLVAWAEQVGTAPAHIAALLAQAEQAWQKQNTSRSRSIYAQALAEAEQGGVPIDIRTVLDSWATRLIDTGQLERATTLVGQAARWADRDYESALLQLRLYHALGKTDAWRHALQTARDLAGERKIPPGLVTAPAISTVSLMSR